MDSCHPEFDPNDYDEIIVQDTDAYNSPSWLFSDRCGFRYFPTIEVIKRFGILGYIQICLTMVHVLPGQVSIAYNIVFYFQTNPLNPLFSDIELLIPSVLETIC